MTKRYVVLNNITGVAGTVTNVVLGNAPLHDGWIEIPSSSPITVGWVYDGVEFSFAAPVDSNTQITKLAFKQRLTQVERIAVREAAKVNPEVFDFQDLIDSATFVDLSRQDTIDALNTLEAAGLLGTGRANEILTATIQDVERFRG